MSNPVTESHWRLNLDTRVAEVAKKTLEDYLYEHPYGGPESEKVIEEYITAERARLRSMLAYRRAVGWAEGRIPATRPTTTEPTP
jgi:hypothetical protein